jgi:hypothetical protein
MRRFLLALLMTSVVASLQAITINWQVANSEFAWADEGVTTFLVYSQSDSLSAEDVYKGNYGNYTGYRVNQQVGTTTVGGVEVNSYMTLGFGSNETSTVGSKAYVAVDLEGQAFGSGYFYLVVFKTVSNDGTNDQYAVSKAVQYTAGTNANGIYDITVDDNGLTMGDFIEIPWLGGTWRDAVVPEPTALAFLALGIAGLALRRKI